MASCESVVFNLVCPVCGSDKKREILNTVRSYECSGCDVTFHECINNTTSVDLLLATILPNNPVGCDVCCDGNKQKYENAKRQYKEAKKIVKEYEKNKKMFKQRNMTS